MVIIFFFDDTQTLLKIETNALSIIQTQELDDTGLLNDSLSVSIPNDEKLLDAQYMAVKSNEGNAQAFDMYRIVDSQTSGEVTYFTGIQLAYYELAGYVVEDLRPTDRTVSYVAGQLLADTEWRVGYVDDLPNVTTNFYYLSAKDAFAKLQSAAGCEVIFKVEISGQGVTDKWVEIYDQLGDITRKRFTYGDSALEVAREINHNDIYTALVGQGKGEESGDGYGRKITFEDVEWSIANGDPVDKPLGQKYVELPDMTAEYGIPVTGGKRPRITTVELDTDDPATLLALTYQALVNIARPKVLFKANVVNIGGGSIGDAVTIHRYDLGIHYETRLKRVERDKLNDNRTLVELGDVVHQSSTRKTNSIIKDVSNRIDEVEQNIVNYVGVTADGKNAITWGNDEPEQVRTGDLWYRNHPSINGEKQMLIWNGTSWVISLDTSRQSEAEQAIVDAQATADEARQNTENLQIEADSILKGLGVDVLSETHAQTVTDIQTNVGDVIASKVDGESVEYQSLVEQSDLYERVIGNTEADMNNNVARIVQGSNIIQQEVRNYVGDYSDIATDHFRDDLPRATNRFDEVLGLEKGQNYEIIVSTTSGTLAGIDIVFGAKVKDFEKYKEEAGYNWFRGIARLDGDPIGLRNTGGYTLKALKVESIKRYDGDSLNGRLTNVSTTVTQLADSWALGIKSNDELVAAINASTEGVYVKGKHITLDGDTIVDGTFTVTDTIFAEDMSIDKFTTGTLNAAEVNIINMNVDNLVGNTSTFVKSAWNDISSRVTIEGTGMKISTTNSWDLWLDNSGIDITDKSGNITGKMTALVSAVTGKPISIGLVAERGFDAIVGYQRSAFGTTYDRAISVDGTTGETTFYKKIQLKVNDIFPNGGSTDNFYFNSISNGGVRWANNKGRASIDLNNDSTIDLNGDVNADIIYPYRGADTGIELRPGTVSGNKGVWLRDTTESSGIFMARNGHMYVMVRGGIYSMKTIIESAGFSVS